MLRRGAMLGGVLGLAVLSGACSDAKGGAGRNDGGAGAPSNSGAAGAGRTQPSSRGSERPLRFCARYGLGVVGRLALSPDGATVVVGGTDLALSFRRADGRMGPAFPVEGAVESLAFSPDGRQLAVAAGGHIDLFDAADGELEATIDMPSSNVSMPLVVHYAADGAMLVVADLARVRFHALPGLAVLRDVDGEYGWSAARIAFAQDGRVLVRTPAGVDAIDPATGDRTLRLAAPSKETDAAFALAPDGRIATAGPGGRVRVWSPAGELTFEATIEGRVDSLEFSDDGARLAAMSGLNHGNLHVWELAGGAEILKQKLVADGNDLNHGASVRFEAGGRRLLANDAHHVFAFDLESGQRVEQYGWGHPARITDVAVSPDGRFIAGATVDGVIVWDERAETIVSSLVPADGPSYQVAFSPDGRSLYSSAHSILCEWDYSTGTLRRKSAELHGSMINELAVAPDGSRVLARIASNELVMVSVDTFEPLFRVPTPDAVSTFAAFARDSAAFVGVKRRGEIAAWDAQSGAELASVPIEWDVPAGAFTAGGKHLVIAGGSDLFVYEWPSLKRLRALEPREPSVLALWSLPDERHVLSISGYNGHIALWDLPAALRINEGKLDMYGVPRIALPDALDVSIVHPRRDSLRLYCTGRTKPQVITGVW